jgi:hypothetical protein
MVASGERVVASGQCSATKAATHVSRVQVKSLAPSARFGRYKRRSRTW